MSDPSKEERDAALQWEEAATAKVQGVLNTSHGTIEETLIEYQVASRELENATQAVISENAALLDQLIGDSSNNTD
jgi:hypothetical protein